VGGQVINGPMSFIVGESTSIKVTVHDTLSENAEEQRVPALSSMLNDSGAQQHLKRL